MTGLLKASQHPPQTPLPSVCMCEYMHMHVYVCVYVCLYVCMCMCVCVHVYVHVFVCMVVHICVCICACLFMCASMCVHAYVYVPSCTTRCWVFWKEISPSQFGGPQGSLPVSGHSTTSPQVHPGTCGDTYFSSQPTLLHSSWLLFAFLQTALCYSDV